MLIHLMAGEMNIDNGKIKSIELLVLDVDGVLTDGKFTIMPNGDEYKSFHSKDGAGIKYWMRTGGKVALISGRDSKVVSLRAKELGIETVRQGCKNKAPVLLEVLEELNIEPSAAIAVGDDLPDLPMFHICGLSACPSDAVEEVKQTADYVCETRSGEGCVREVVEMMLRAPGKRETNMERYRPGDDRSQG